MPANADSAQGTTSERSLLRTVRVSHARRRTANESRTRERNLPGAGACPWPLASARSCLVPGAVADASPLTAIKAKASAVQQRRRDAIAGRYSAARMALRQRADQIGTRASLGTPDEAHLEQVEHEHVLGAVELLGPGETLGAAVRTIDKQITALKQGRSDRAQGNSGANLSGSIASTKTLSSVVVGNVVSEV